MILLLARYSEQILLKHKHVFNFVSFMYRNSLLSFKIMMLPSQFKIIEANIKRSYPSLQERY